MVVHMNVVRIMAAHPGLLCVHVVYRAGTDCLTLTMLPAGGRPATSWVHIPHAVTHSLVLLKMGRIIARNMLSWLELLISRYFCI